MNRTARLGILGLPGLALTLLAPWSGANAAERVGRGTATVSPGSVEGIVDIDERCPVFSWSYLEGVLAHELVVYRLRDDLRNGLASEAPILRERLPGGASSWSPARCPEPGAAYAWLVRPIGKEGAGPWSEPRFFRSAAPSVAEVEEALAVLRAHLAANGVRTASTGDTATGDTAQALSERAVIAQRAAGRSTTSDAPRSSAAGTSPGIPEPDAVAVRGFAPDKGITFGLYGVSGSEENGSSGVVGRSTAVSGATAGVLGVADGPDGVAGAFENTAGGKLLSGRSGGMEVFSVDGAGAVAAASFAGDASGLTGMDWAALANVPAGFADGIDHDSGGDITEVIAGAGLTGGGTGGSVTLAADLDATQARVMASCPPGAAIAAIYGDGRVGCQIIGEVLTSLSTVDAGTNVGTHTSIAIGADGLPVISYHDQFNARLKVAHCNDAACTGGDETITTLTPTDANGDAYTSIAIGADGLPVISYRAAGGALAVVKCDDASCATEPTITTVDGAIDVQYTSIAIGIDGYPVISYYDDTNDDLKVAHCDDAACSGTGEILTTVDAAGGVGSYTSIAIGVDGLPVISYRDGTNTALKVAHCDDVACTAGGETLTTVDSVGDLARYTSIAIGADGFPVISYHSGDLKVAKCDDVACAGGGEIVTVVSPAGNAGWYGSVAVGTDGLPVISFFESTGGNLRIAKCNDAACAGGDGTVTDEIVVTLDSVGKVGWYTSIAIGVDGLPVISYYDADNFDLKVAKCANVSCS